MTYSSSKLARAKALTSRFGQEHLLRFFDALPPGGQEILLGQILSVDFPLVASLHRDLVAGESGSGTPVGSVEPLQAKAWDEFNIAERAAMANQGKRALREGRVAAFLVAGGQGTRLGHAGPKGAFDIGLPSGKPLFQLQAERLLKLSALAGGSIPWYIMTSEENHAETVAFFRERGFFGLPEHDVFFFPQGQLPMVDRQGRILLADRGRLAMGPNGNGGCFLALSRSGALADMRERGIEQVFFHGVDNALVRICDPRFVGFAIQAGLPAASKAVVKAGPREKVGVLCLKDGRPSVLEYSEMTEEMVTARDGRGRLLFDSANIAVHLFTRGFLEAQAEIPLPYHVAHKRIACVDERGTPVTPDAPNAYKFEMFMFDLFPRAEGMAALMVPREEEFAPVKNADGADSPATARELILRLHRKWALDAGLSEEELAGRLLEISPLTSYAGEGLDAHALRQRLRDGIVTI